MRPRGTALRGSDPLVCARQHAEAPAGECWVRRARLPELPDVTVYVEAIERTLAGKTLRALRVPSPFVLRTVSPSPDAFAGKRITGARRVGKRVAIAFEDDLFAVVHLMIAGRLKWTKADAKLGGRGTLAVLAFDEGNLVLTEAGSKHRAALHLVEGLGAVRALDAGGIEPLEVDVEAFAAALKRENHTLKRALTDPRLVAGVGNAYSDEILHVARLSPMKLTQSMSDDEMRALHDATVRVLREWTERLRSEAKSGWPSKVTAFREGMRVHGRYGQACPECGATVQRIVRGESESNYCPRCQTGGRMLSDRALARLMHDDWPRTIDEWEVRVGARQKK